MQWAIDRIAADPTARSATITTFQPLSDTAYIPCVSMLDFWAPEGRLDLVVYAHGLDFGKKAYGNLVELADIQWRVAAGLDVSPAAPDPEPFSVRTSVARATNSRT